MTVEMAAIVIGVVNGFILLIKPIGRIHSRLDILDYRVQGLERDLARSAVMPYDEDAYRNRGDP